MLTSCSYFQLRSGTEASRLRLYLFGQVPLDLPLLLLLLQVVSSCRRTTWRNSRWRTTDDSPSAWFFLFFRRSPSDLRFSMFLCSSSSAVGLWLNRLDRKEKKGTFIITGNIFLYDFYVFVWVCSDFTEHTNWLRLFFVNLPNKLKYLTVSEFSDFWIESKGISTFISLTYLYFQMPYYLKALFKFFWFNKPINSDIKSQKLFAVGQIIIIWENNDWSVKENMLTVISCGSFSEFND